MVDNDGIEIKVSRDEAKKKAVPEKLDLLIDFAFITHEKVEEIKEKLYGNGQEGIIEKGNRHEESIKQLKSAFFWIITVLVGLGIAGFSIILRGGK